MSERRKSGLVVMSLFFLLMARACAYGVEYWPQLDDYIQYHNYLNSPSFSVLQEKIGLLASRPLAGIMDYFVWGRMFSVMIVGVAIISLLYALSAVMLKGLLGRYFAVSPMFLVIMTLLPLGVEGTYWMSASTRIVCGLFFAVLTGVVFVRWLDTGHLGWLLLYLPLQVIPFGFYEQSGIFSITLVMGIGIINWIRKETPWKRGFLSLWSVPAMGLYFFATRMFATGSAYSTRAEVILPFSPYYWKTFFPTVMEQMRETFLTGNFYTQAKGFIRGVREIVSGELAIWAVVLVGICLLFWWTAGKETSGEGRGIALPLLSGFLLALGPISIFFVLGNPWFSFRGAVTSFGGIALIADTLLCALWRKLKLKPTALAGCAAAVAFVFCVAGASEIGDYRDTYRNDQQIARTVLDQMVQDGLGELAGQSIGVLGIESSYLPNQNYLYHEHVHGCTESGWAFHGLLGYLGGEELPSVSPLPVAPIYWVWNAEVNCPSGFDRLYYYDFPGNTIRHVTLEQTGEHDFNVLDDEHVLLGVIWEDTDGLGYFKPSNLSNAG